MDPASNDQALTTTVVITLFIMSFITIVVVVVIVISVVRLVWKRRAEGRAHHSISYRMRTDSQSDYSSEISHGTHSTQVGNGGLSHATNKTAVGMTNQVYMLNPPPSPISTIHHHAQSLALTEADDISTYSKSFSDYAAPPPPCPSINYDNVSCNMSSVSQTQFPASINGGGPNTNYYHHHQYQQFQQQQQHLQQQQGGIRQPGRNPNPLLSRNLTQQRYMLGNGGVPYQTRGQNAALPSHQSNQGYYFQGQHPYPITELDTITQTETESTLSLATENQDVFLYDASMPHPPPPGRPSSPVTVYSEYQGHPPLSPQSSRRSSSLGRSSSSSSSFSSQD